MSKKPVAKRNKKSKKGTSTTVIIIISILAAALLGTGLWFIIREKAQKTKTPVIFTYQNFKYTVSENDTIEIAEYIGKEKAVNIPSEIDSKKVTSIGRKAFYSKFGIEEVIIPDTVETIKDFAFYSCTELEKVEIPETIKTIGEFAFTNTAWFARTTDEFVIAGDGILLFYSGSDETVIIPDTVKFISTAFYYNTDTLFVNIPEGVTHIGTSAFENCTNLVRVTIPKSVVKIDNYAFNFCDNMENIYYRGNEEQWKAIEIGEENDILNELKFIYDYE